MPINVACHGCGKAMSVPDHFAGKSGCCKKCGTKFVISPAARAATPAGIGPISVACHCGHRFHVAGSYAGRQTRCPACKAVLDVVKARGSTDHPMADEIDVASWFPTDKLSASTDPDSTPTTSCPYCGETILSVAKKCKHCGEYLDEELRASKITVSGSAPHIVVQANNTHVNQPPRPAVYVEQERGWNPGIAAVLSLVIPGAGQMYKGHVVEGIVWLFGVIFGYALLILPGIAIHILCIVLAASGKPRSS